MCSFSGNSLLGTIWYLIPLPDVFFIKNVETIEPCPGWYLSYFEYLSRLNALLGNTLSANVLLFKSLEFQALSDSFW